jgi:hypothetical protein
MRRASGGLFAGIFAALLTASTPSFAQQAPGGFHWVDFHSPQDQSVVVWVTRAMQPEKWTAIREIGVEYDAALVVTTLRTSDQSAPNADTFSVWNVSLTNHLVTPLFHGVNLRWVDWMRFAESGPLEPAMLYDNCSDCAADTYLTSFYYDVSHRMWAARWMQGGQGLHLWSAHTPPGVEWTQVYAAMADPNGRELVGTWSHFEYGAKKPSEDSIYQYDLDPWSGLERTQQLNGKQAEAMKERLCRGQDAVVGLTRGQDSPLCEQLTNPHISRKPATTPPANNRGQSVPPGSRTAH